MRRVGTQIGNSGEIGGVHNTVMTGIKIGTPRVHPRTTMVERVKEKGGTSSPRGGTNNLQGGINNPKVGIASDHGKILNTTPHKVLIHKEKAAIEVKVRVPSPILGKTTKKVAEEGEKVREKVMVRGQVRGITHPPPAGGEGGTRPP